jgi:hypothetical protein
MRNEIQEIVDFLSVSSRIQKIGCEYRTRQPTNKLNIFGMNSLKRYYTFAGEKKLKIVP